jgi:hypothetical protein
MCAANNSVDPNYFTFLELWLCPKVKASVCDHKILPQIWHEIKPRTLWMIQCLTPETVKFHNNGFLVCQYYFEANSQKWCCCTLQFFELHDLPLMFAPQQVIWSQSLLCPYKHPCYICFHSFAGLFCVSFLTWPHHLVHCPSTGYFLSLSFMLS